MVPQISKTFYRDIGIQYIYSVEKKSAIQNIDQLQCRQDIINSIIMFNMTKHQTHQTGQNSGASA